jgi:hypothetical protein
MFFMLNSCSRREPNAAILSKLPFGGVNSPQNEQKISGKVEVIGWALSEEGIESVSLYVDRAFVANCSLGLPRLDVAKVYPHMSGSGSSGWSTTLDSSNVPPGWHELIVQARSKSGTTRDLGSIPVLVQN